MPISSGSEKGNVVHTHHGTLHSHKQQIHARTRNLDRAIGHNEQKARTENQNFQNSYKGQLWMFSPQRNHNSGAHRGARHRNFIMMLPLHRSNCPLHPLVIHTYSTAMKLPFHFGKVHCHRSEMISECGFDWLLMRISNVDSESFTCASFSGLQVLCPVLHIKLKQVHDNLPNISNHSKM